MSSFLVKNAKRVTVASFLKEASGDNSIKYRYEAGKKHHLYFPFITAMVDDGAGNMVEERSIIASQLSVHTYPKGEWTSYAPCMEGIVYKDENGTLVNDGRCPFCDRVNDAWKIVNYRTELEKVSCGLVGDALEKRLQDVKKGYAEEMKSQKAIPYLYAVVVLFETNDAGDPILNNGVPVYELKVMRLGASRLKKFTDIFGANKLALEGGEMIIGYTNDSDARLVVSQASISPVVNGKFVDAYPGLIDKINDDVAKFSWEGIDKAFIEWSDMSTAQAEAIMNEAFEAWDRYVEESKTNPNAKYLEYMVPATQPSLGAGMNMMGAYNQQMMGNMQMPQMMNNMQMSQMMNNGQPMNNFSGGELDINKALQGNGVQSI